MKDPNLFSKLRKLHKFEIKFFFVKMQHEYFMTISIKPILFFYVLCKIYFVNSNSLLTLLIEELF